MSGLRSSFLATTTIIVSLLCAGPWRAEAAPYGQVDLVSNLPGLATITDPQLVNPWGFSHSATSPFWTSNQGTNTATLYAVTGGSTVSKTIINPPAGYVAIPTTVSGPPQGPTGQVNNSNTSAFDVGNGGNGQSAHFIFANLNGTISAWDTGTTAFIQATVANAVFTGLAINHNQTELYAANNGGSGGIDVFSSTFAPVSLAPGAFATPLAVTALNLVPFNVQDINSKVYVTYAPAGHAAEAAATGGMGAVVIFDENGNWQQTIINNALASPWGVAVAPAAFGQFSNDLLVGNFSYVDSEINAFDPTTGLLLGTIPIDTGFATAGGLWDIGFGTGGSNGSPDDLYFTDGINGETAGLFGAIGVPEAPTWLIFCAALGLGGLLMRRRRAVSDEQRCGR